MKDRVPNGTYLTAKGNLVIGVASCF